MTELTREIIKLMSQGKSLNEVKAKQEANA